MRALWLIALLAACASRPPANRPAPIDVAVAPPAPESGDEARPAEPAGGRDFLGRLGRNERFYQMAPLEICVDDGRLYRTSEFRLGRTNLGGRVPLRPEDAGKIVLVRGRERPLRALLEPAGECGPDYGSDAPQAQMRSDWVSPEGGLHSTWEKLDQLTFIDAEAARVVRMHQVLSRDEDTVLVRIDNPLDYALDGLEVAAHYEGGPGKSMPKYRRLTLDLGPHQGQELTLERRIDEEWTAPGGRPRRVWYELESLELRLDRPRVLIDVVLYLLSS